MAVCLYSSISAICACTFAVMQVTLRLCRQAFVSLVALMPSGVCAIAVLMRQAFVPVPVHLLCYAADVPLHSCRYAQVQRGTDASGHLSRGNMVLYAAGIAGIKVRYLTFCASHPPYNDFSFTRKCQRSCPEQQQLFRKILLQIFNHCEADYYLFK